MKWIRKGKYLLLVSIFESLLVMEKEWSKSSLFAKEKAEERKYKSASHL